MIRLICLAMILTAPVACGGEQSGEAFPTALASATDRQPATGASFQANLAGAANQTVAGTGSVAGAKYNRYHINMSSGARDGQPAVVIAFGRTDTAAPTAGTYSLGGRDGFDGSVEIYSRPQRDFLIRDGELVIAEALGDVLTGRFILTAEEETEEYTATPSEIRVEGTFQTRPGN